MSIVLTTFIGLALCIVIVAIVLFLLGAKRNKESRTFRRFKEVTGYKEGQQGNRSIEDEMLAGSFYERNLAPIVEQVAEVFKSDDQDERWEKLKKRIKQANINISPPQFRAVQLLIGLVNVGVIAVLSLLFRPSTSRTIGLVLLLAFAGGAGGYIVPSFYLSRLISSRQYAVRKKLPYAMDLLVVTVEAGLGFTTALRRVKNNMDGVFANEISIVLDDIKLGANQSSALKSMVERVPVEDLRRFVQAVNQANEMGGDIGRVLRVQADDMRTRQRQSVEEKAQKAPVKMLIPMVIFIFPTIFVVIGGPILIKLVYNTQGLSM